jgi:hypothetical protein
MSSERDQQVTVRLLPDGEARPGVFSSLNRQLLQIDMMSAPLVADLKSGDLVEVTSPRNVYLGEVRSRRGQTTIVGIEHSLDRESLALIRQVWHGPSHS